MVDSMNRVVDLPCDLSFLYRGRDIRFKLTPRGDYIADTMRKTGFFFDAQRLLGELRYIPRGASVIDIGAHIGVTTVWYSCVCGARSVVAVEPDRDHYGLLLDNIALNNISGVVTPVRAAVGASCGHAACVRRVPGNTGGSAYRDAKSGEVTMLTLDSMVDRAIVTSADVLKVDVEGNECAVLDGAVSFFSRFSPLMIVEVWGPNERHVDPRFCDTAANHSRFFSKVHELGYSTVAQHGDDYVLARL